MSLDAIFNPRSIAVVGATETPATAANASGAPAASFNAHTQIFFNTLIDWGYQGDIYPVNTRGEYVHGLKVYRSLRDIPGPVDYVICLVPADATPGLVEDCVAKGVRGLHLYTAGFAETGLAERVSLQDNLVRVARGGGVRLIGPNCMGIYRPAMGMTYAANFPREPGKAAFISQSGSYTLLLVRAAAARGVRFSKVVSYGNASDLNEIDLLNYLADDPETEIIGAYLEGTRDGAGLAKVLAKAAARKPTIIVKKGSTERGRPARRPGCPSTPPSTGRPAPSAGTWTIAGGRGGSQPRSRTSSRPEVQPDLPATYGPAGPAGSEPSSAAFTGAGRRRRRSVRL